MLDHPRRLLGLAVLAVACLPLALDAAPAAPVGPADADRAEGGTARVQGLVTDVRVRPDGSSRLTLAADGHAIEVDVQGRTDATPGAWAVAEGRVLRTGGRLLLWVEDAAQIWAALPPAVASPSWSQVAADPGRWSGPLRLAGLVERESLRDLDGHRVALGSGPWPAEGAVEATGALLYEPACLCHRLHAARVDPWTP